jgi:hypothetical protein
MVASIKYVFRSYSMWALSGPYMFWFDVSHCTINGNVILQSLIKSTTIRIKCSCKIVVFFSLWVFCLVWPVGYECCFAWSSRVGLNILLSTLSADTFNLCSYFNMWVQFSLPCKIGKVIAFCILIWTLLWFIAFTATLYNKKFSGYQPCLQGTDIPRRRGQMVLETLVFSAFNQLTRLVDREFFIILAFLHFKWEDYTNGIPYCLHIWAFPERKSTIVCCVNTVMETII